jgi:hypothetical protein
MGRDVRRQGCFLRRRQLARPVTATRAGADLAGAATPDQRLVDIGHADEDWLHDLSIDKTADFASTASARMASPPSPSMHTVQVFTYARSAERLPRAADLGA